MMAQFLSLHGRWWSYFLVTAQFGCVGLILATGPWLARDMAYLLLEMAGVGLGIWALASVGLSHFSILPDVQGSGRLATNGPYRVIRHPMYTAVLVAALALVLDEFFIARLLVWVSLLIVLVMKLTYEETLLGKHFPQYREYQRRTYRLIPWVY